MEFIVNYKMQLLFIEIVFISKDIWLDEPLTLFL